MSQGSISRFEVVFCRFPDTISGIIGGFTHFEKSIDKYFVFIDESRTGDEQVETLKHEMVHVFLKHLERNTTEEADEAEAISKADKITDDQLEYMLSLADSIKHYDGVFDDSGNLAKPGRLIPLC